MHVKGGHNIASEKRLPRSQKTEKNYVYQRKKAYTNLVVKLKRYIWVRQSIPNRTQKMTRSFQV